MKEKKDSMTLKSHAVFYWIMQSLYYNPENKVFIL